MAMLDDFKAFAIKGNVIDLAVGTVIGGAFGKIVAALVEHIIMPLVGKIMPSGGYEKFELAGLKIGLFLAAIVNFMIIAFVLFIVVQAIQKATHKPAPPAAPPEPPAQEKLLAEIRDLLRK
jgi:large conductance mechanosensitive channel